MSHHTNEHSEGRGGLWLPVFIGTKVVKVYANNGAVVPAQHRHGFEPDDCQAFIGPALKGPTGSHILIPRSAHRALVARAREDKRQGRPGARAAIKHYTKGFRPVDLSASPMRIIVPQPLADRARNEGGQLWICGDDDKLRLMSQSMYGEYEEEVDRLVQQIGDDTPWD